MTIGSLLRKVFRTGDRTTDHPRRVDERRQQDAARAWTRPGGPVDPGPTA